MKQQTRPARHGVSRSIAAAVFIGAGANHFRSTHFYEQIVPPMFPARHALVVISGICEMLGGVGLLVPPLRRPAGWGLIALLIAVFPANLYMALSHDPRATMNLPRWALWGRLPLQAVLIAWVEWSSRNRPRANRGFEVVSPGTNGHDRERETLAGGR